MGRPESAGPAEVLSAHDLGAECPLARIVVEGDFRAVEEESEPVPVVEKAFDRLLGRGGKGLGTTKIVFGLLFHEGQMVEERLPVLDPVFGGLSESGERSDSGNPGRNPRLHGGMLDEDPEEVSPSMAPTKGESESDDLRRRILVGGVAVDDRG